ncbi:MAG: A/G-specific adenine glycosylase [Spirochaetes bacterium]|nr:A/G-specific adenine glycosylase [Spirochaetota bacterium]
MSSPSVSRGPAGFPKAWSLLVTHRRVLQKRLLAWFRENARDLPWRHRRTPYRVWVSELMLQQTQVATVIPYYLRWMERFPDVESLARAPLAVVLKHWEGLGYYRRARYLHAGAKKIVGELGGAFPSTHVSLLGLPGVGPYTAGAIASLAFGLPHPLVDGNVERVFLRLLGDGRDPDSPVIKRQLWEFAALLIPTMEPGAFNEGLMELGAVICTSDRPGCVACPLRRYCNALKMGSVNQIPRPKARAQVTRVYRVAIVLECRGTFLVRQRSEGGRLGGLWEFPEMECSGEEASQAPLARLIHRLGASGARVVALAKINHAIMNERVTTRFWLATLRNSTEAGRASGSWRSRADLRTLAMPAAHRQAAKAIEKLIRSY